MSFFNTPTEDFASTFSLPVYIGNVFGKNALMEVCHAGVRAV